ncbi:MAG: 8-amino-7-oxononanoate synthase [Deltaproteobacteria bacterium]|nr:8-amino-7-oxononanoate synthase [Candidatus Anaeroferrophillacea bacterium]
MKPVNDSFRRELEELESAGMLRSMRTVTGPQRAATSVDGRPMLVMCSNNYLGLADHPRLAELAIELTKTYGCSAAASRLISGTMSPHRRLEAELAYFKGTEAALVFNCGYMANLAVLSTVVAAGDAIFSDELNHASIVDGCRLSRAEVYVYRHADAGHLEELLAACGAACRRRLIVTDSVFSMDGDLAPLPAIVALAEKYDALLLVDDAHATGVLGPGGRGSCAHFGIAPERVDFLMGTLGKALGSCGAFVAARLPLIDFLVNRARPFIYTTALPPGAIGASLAALALLAEEPEMVDELRRKTAVFRAGVRRLGFAMPDDPTPIVPVVIGESVTTMAVSRRLLEAGIFVQGIRPPTVAPGRSLLRFTVTRDLRAADLDRALEILGREAAIISGQAGREPETGVVPTGPQVSRIGGQ